MDKLQKMIIEAIEDAYIDITENIYEYDGTEETLDAFVEDAKLRIGRVFKELGA